MWFGTNKGVSRYDGTNFMTLTGEDGISGYVGVIAEDREGILWFGADSELLRYDGESVALFADQADLPGRAIEAIVQDRKGHLWVGTTDGLSQYDGDRWRTYTTEDGLVNNDIKRHPRRQQGQSVVRYKGRRKLLQWNGMDFFYY